MPDLSAVIIARDEERTIGKVLASIKDLVNEIVLVDSGSTDRTVEIAKECGARVIHQDWLGYAAQKNFALEQAGGEWILSLDADEIVTPELKEEIRKVLSADDIESWQGFKIGRLMFVGERAIMHGGFYPDPQLRLFRRGMGRFNDRLVHESVSLSGRKRMLRHHLLHYSYRDLAHFENAHEKYARLAAQQYLRMGVNPFQASILNLYLHPAWTFVYRYILRAGFLDGIMGLKMNLAYSAYVRKKIVYLKEAIKLSEK